MIREDILNVATARVCARAQDYGEPEDNFTKIAEYWSIYLGKHVSALDVAHMMLLLKLARADAVGSIDTYVDMAGYAACAGEIWHKYKQMEATVNTAWEEIKKEDTANHDWLDSVVDSPNT